MTRRATDDLPVLSRGLIVKRVTEALEEDLGRGDITSALVVSPSKLATGYLLAKEEFLLAGLDIAKTAFQLIDPKVKIQSRLKDGTLVRRGQKLAVLYGHAQALLSAERCALNFLQRLSGIATKTYKVASQVKGTKAKILDTRKTTPLLRAFEKYAVRVGGGLNHRFGLDDGILIKDNHVRMANGVRNAIRRAKQGAPQLLRIEVEVKSLTELKEALRESAEMILLDNMDTRTVRQAVILSQGRAKLEASGGITIKNVRDYALTGVDYISLGSLTHSSQSVDISFEME